MSYSSKKLQDVDTLADKYQESFGGKYSPGDSSSSFGFSSINLKGVWNLIVLSRARLGILIGACFLLGMIILIKTKAKFIMTKPRTLGEHEKIDTTNLLKYSFIIGFVLSVIIFALSYKFPFIKKILFKEEDCDLCNA
ncbi:MAG: hypothetical protein PHG66_04810 [Candidatus Colwellbacteria bacterium]|nr:hypothetical protein [Candidatus Colwellbacteria bacterium]